jgi:ABC-type uncharacterized transport system permease subunit
MRIDLTPRADRSALTDALAPVLAFLAALVIGGFVVAAMGRSPAAAFVTYFVAPLSEVWSLQEVALKAAPLALIATGLAFCFRANVWNIGAEGQFVVGGLFGGWIGVASHGATGNTLWVLPLMLAVGACAGMLYALIPALLKVRLGVSEILTSLMLVYVAELLLDYMARGPLRDPAGFNFPQSVTFDDAARLPYLMEGDTLHAVRPGSPASSKWPAGSASSSPRSRRATASPRSSWPSWAGSRRLGSWWRPSSSRSPPSAARARRST